MRQVQFRLFTQTSHVYGSMTAGSHSLPRVGIDSDGEDVAEVDAADACCSAFSSIADSCSDIEIVSVCGPLLRVCVFELLVVLFCCTYLLVVCRGSRNRRQNTSRQAIHHRDEEDALLLSSC